MGRYYKRARPIDEPEDIGRSKQERRRAERTPNWTTKWHADGSVTIDSNICYGWPKFYGRRK